ncbi:hypothetical protein D3C84_938710 [compost metagenome]
MDEATLQLIVIDDLPRGVTKNFASQRCRWIYRRLSTTDHGQGSGFNTVHARSFVDQVNECVVRDTTCCKDRVNSCIGSHGHGGARVVDVA